MTSVPTILVMLYTLSNYSLVSKDSSDKAGNFVTAVNKLLGKCKQKLWEVKKYMHKTTKCKTMATNKKAEILKNLNRHFYL